MDVFKRYGRVYLCVMAVAAALALILSDAWSYLAASGSCCVQRPVVVLDAGHGGEDGGAVSVTGVLESQINLQITLRLRDLLLLCGCDPILIRDGDYAIYDSGCSTISQKKVSDLRNRVAKIQEISPAVLISLHQNQFSDSRYSGAQVFYAPTAGSEALAKQMQETLRLCLNPANQRQCKAAGEVYLMQHVTCTGILIECGFLSNREEEALLRQEDYQKKTVCAITAGLMQYLCAEQIL